MIRKKELTSKIPVNVRLVCEPSGITIPLILLYTGTRDGFDIWRHTSVVTLPAGTTQFTMHADVLPAHCKVDVEISQ